MPAARGVFAAEWTDQKSREQDRPVPGFAMPIGDEGLWRALLQQVPELAAVIPAALSQLLI